MFTPPRNIWFIVRIKKRHDLSNRLICLKNAPLFSLIEEGKEIVDWMKY